MRLQKRLEALETKMSVNSDTKSLTLQELTPEKREQVIDLLTKQAQSDEIVPWPEELQCKRDSIYVLPNGVTEEQRQMRINELLIKSGRDLIF